jgi:hypothetical protein
VTPRGRAHFAIHDLVRFTEKLPPLAVSQHHVAHKKIPQHRGADLTGKRAALLPVHVLRAELHLFRPAKASLTFDNAVNGGAAPTSTSDESPISRTNVSTKAAASPCSMFIFQLAATIFFLMQCSTELTEL